jgi:formate-dependent nitrite reductase membrane component NrfD
MMKQEIYEWMVKHTPQKEWIEGKGILLYLAFFFIELGAGLYFVSLFFGSKEGMLLGWLICLILGGGFHFVYLGKPFRFYRAVLKPATSWISRGMIFVVFFAVVGFINLVAVWQGQGSLFLTVLMGVIAFLETIYAGFVVSYVAAIPLWNTALLPALYTVASLWGGIGLLVVINLLSGHEIELMESWARILLLAYGFMMVLYLLTMRYRSRAAAASTERMVKGDMATLFWGGAVMIGFVYPCIVNMMGLAGEVAPGVLVTAVLCEGLGDLSMRYCILKSALYAPLIPAREI